MKTLDEKTAVVTGGGSGIGRAIAHALAEAGTHVLIADVNEDAARSVANELRAHGVRSAAVQCDVSNFEAVTRLADQAYAEFGAIDILCNNAGVTWRPYRSFMDATLEDIEFVFGINYWGVVHGMKAFLPRMRQQRGEKHIVNTASVGSLLPMTGHVAYGSSKAAVAYMSEVVAEELAPHGFGVTILCPGVVKTALASSTARLRPDVPTSEAQHFEPVATPMMDRVLSVGVFTPEMVGTMVCNAILDNTLYLHTSTLPSDLVVERLHTQFGAQTVGRAT